MSRTFYGKYRGVATNVEDPLRKGRIRARVPDALGDVESGWAMPCSPFAGNGFGLFALPNVGAGVWIEFEHGDPSFPVWAGCWWGSADQTPPSLKSAPYKQVVIQTDGGHSLVLDDTDGTGGITLKTSIGMKIVMDPSGITIDNGQGAVITLQAVQVSVNNDALTII